MSKNFVSMLFVLSVMAGIVIASKPAIRGPFGFEPLTTSAVIGSRPACAPFALPDGFSRQ